jgi:hypothetical protein
MISGLRDLVQIRRCAGRRTRDSRRASARDPARRALAGRRCGTATGAPAQLTRCGLDEPYDVRCRDRRQAPVGHDEPSNVRSSSSTTSIPARRAGAERGRASVVVFDLFRRTKEPLVDAIVTIASSPSPIIQPTRAIETA